MVRNGRGVSAPGARERTRAARKARARTWLCRSQSERELRLGIAGSMGRFSRIRKPGSERCSRPAHDLPLQLLHGPAAGRLAFAGHGTPRSGAGADRTAPWLTRPAPSAMWPPDHSDLILNEAAFRVRRVTVARSTGHVLELRDVERLRPCETALGEHLDHRLDALAVIQAAERHEDRSGEALQVGGEHPGAATRAVVPIQALARLGDIMKRLRLATDQRKIILGHAEERGRFTAGRLLAVEAVTKGDEGGIGIEFELYGAARAPADMFLWHRSLLCNERTVCARCFAARRHIALIRPGG